jgi:hypothetical protein
VICLRYNGGECVYVKPLLNKYTTNKGVSFININKTNNPLSPQTAEHIQTTTHGVDHRGPALGQVQEDRDVNIISHFFTGLITFT